MKLQDFKVLFTCRSFFILNIASIAFIAGFLIFEKFIHWDPAKTPGDPSMIFRDFLWLFYWRWNLDYLIFPAFIIVVFLECFILRKAMEHGARKHVLGTYVVPIVTFGCSFLYMVGIDLAVTWFADTGIDGNWESTTRVFMGMTAQGLYHQFFFWVIPAILIGATCMQAFLRTNNYTETFKTLLVSYAVYCLNLGLLDPIVCHVIGLTPEGAAGGWYWASFGDWAMGGADKIWAAGWITHYVTFAVLAFIGAWVIGRIKKEFMLGLDLIKGGTNPWRTKRAIGSLVLSAGFIGWFLTLIPWIMPTFYFG